MDLAHLGDSGFLDAPRFGALAGRASCLGQVATAKADPTE
jgi:hypothetical protein